MPLRGGLPQGVTTGGRLLGAPPATWAKPHPPSQSPQLPDGGSLVASYDKSGYSHSETVLAAVIYMSKEVRPPRHTAAAPTPCVPPGLQGGGPPGGPSPFRAPL